MIYKQTKVYVGDNSGVDFVKCIRVLRKQIKPATIRNFIIIVIPFRKIKRRFIDKLFYLGLILSVKKQTKRLMGYYVKFLLNKIVLLNDQGSLIGTKFTGNADFSLQIFNCLRILKNFKQYI